jgi:hypothetical protein
MSDRCSSGHESVLEDVVGNVAGDVVGGDVGDVLGMSAG